MNKNIRLDGKITLLSPLSHIGESIGPDSYLSQDVIIGPDSKPIECFIFSGNAFRGILRDTAAIYMLGKLGELKLPLSVFYLLFSGGSLSGDHSVDIDQARAYRKNIPMLSVFGGGVGNQILSGKIKVGSMYPMVIECQRVLPEYLRQDDAPSWRQWTFEKSFTRMDDAKNDNRAHYIQEELLAMDNGDTPKLEGGKKKKDDAPQQMRYSIELLAAGSSLYQRIDLCDMSDLELGAFVSSLVEFSKASYIGGKSGTGHGLVEIEYSWRNAGEKESKGKFISVGNDCLWLSEPAETARNKYDDFLKALYDRYLESNATELMQLLAEPQKKVTKNATA